MYDDEELYDERDAMDEYEDSLRTVRGILIAFAIMALIVSLVLTLSLLA